MKYKQVISYCSIAPGTLSIWMGRVVYTRRAMWKRIRCGRRAVKGQNVRFPTASAFSRTK